MRILQLCHKPPYPPVDGGCLAMNNITTGLLDAGNEVKVLSIVTDKHPFQKEKIPAEYLSATDFEPVFVDTSVNIVDAFSNLITSDSYNVSRFFSTDFDIVLRRVLEEKQYDLVLLESLFTTPYLASIKRFSNAKIVLRSHNLEYMIWQRMAKGSENKIKRAYLNLLARQLREYELNVMNDVDGIAAISAEDELKYKSSGCTKPIITISFGINLDAYNIESEKVEHPSVFHLGSMDWAPNQEAMQWFLEEVWPIVLKSEPNLNFYLAGRSIPETFKQTIVPNAHVIGEIDSAVDFINSKSIMVVPLLSAGGIRVKIIEGMALGKAIVSTKIGAEGIDYTKDENILIADTPQEFAEEIIKLAQSTEKVKAVGKNARLLAIEKFNNKTLTEKLIAFFKQL